MNDLRGFFEDDDKIRVNFSIRLYGKEVSLNNVYDDDASWGEVLSDVTAALEASFGYSFNIEHPNNSDINMGIFVPEREPEPITTIKDLLDD